MGACASVPKAMKAEAAMAPPPEPNREEEVEDKMISGEVVQGEEQEATGVDDNGQLQSLGSLLSEANAESSTNVTPEEQKAEVVRAAEAEKPSAETLQQEMKPEEAAKF